MSIFTVYDNKAKAYLQPFFSKTEGTAIREIRTVVNNPDNFMSQHSEDYSLFHIGEYDEISGKITASDPSHIINLLSLRDIDDSQLSFPNMKANSLDEAVDISKGLMEDNNEE